MAPEPLAFICPRCHGDLVAMTPGELSCTKDNLTFQQVGGVWHFLLTEQQAYYDTFIHEYETVRRGEGRGSHDPAYYQALPYRRLYPRLPGEWDIRRASFDGFLRHVLTPLENSLKRPLTAIDLGAGSGWLSNRLACRGHRLAAVDLAINDFDGLGCHVFYETAFTPVQAAYDCLPFQDGAFDLVVFNASLHYSIDYKLTLGEALRILAPGGQIVVLDSPVYRDGGSGEQMVEEREAQFQQRFGLRSNALPSQNYLTYDRLEVLEGELGIRWKWFTPFYGLRWLLRPIKAKLLGQREPAKFHVLVGMKDEGGRNHESVEDAVRNTRTRKREALDNDTIV